MKDDDDILKNLQHSLGNLKGNFHVLESSIPVKQQMEYFHFSEKVKKDKTIRDISIEDQISALLNPDSSIEEKKYFMVKIAGSANVTAYRALEAYCLHPDPELTDWSKMALMEARVALEADLSDEKQIFISTGLGGKGNNLRFFGLFKSAELKPFSDYQKELIEREFPFNIEKNGGEVESLDVKENYITLVFLMHFNTNIKHVLDEVVIECNQYGDFIKTAYMVTNVKIYGEEEIQKELEKDRR